MIGRDKRLGKIQYKHLGRYESQEVRHFEWDARAHTSRRREGAQVDTRPPLTCQNLRPAPRSRLGAHLDTHPPPLQELRAALDRSSSTADLRALVEKAFDVE